MWNPACAELWRLSCRCLPPELAGEPDEDPPHHDAPLHSMHQAQPKLQASDLHKRRGTWHKTVKKRKWCIYKKTGLNQFFFSSGHHATGGLWNRGDYSYQCCWFSNKVKLFLQHFSVFFLVPLEHLVTLYFFVLQDCFPSFFATIPTICKTFWFWVWNYSYG